MRLDDFQVYKDASRLVKRWRWRRVAPNGEIIADSSEGYVSKWNAKRACRRVFGDVEIKEI